MGSSICLLGSAPSSVQLAPFNDPNWEIWACSPTNWRAPRVDAWFELHSLDRKVHLDNYDYLNMLLKHPRVYVSAPDARLPNAIQYPKKEVYDFFGGGIMLDSFMQSSVSYMFAMAIMQKPDRIGMWGIDMAHQEEYAFQRPGVHFFIRECDLRDIPVSAPPQSDIMEPLPPYGYKEHLPKFWRINAREEELKKRIQKAQSIIQEAKREAELCSGGLMQLNYDKQTYLRDNSAFGLIDKENTDG